MRLPDIITTVVAMIRALPEWAAQRLDHWTLSQHRPEDAGDGHPVCLSAAHRRPVDWPCRDVLGVMDRLSDRHPEVLDGQSPDLEREDHDL